MFNIGQVHAEVTKNLIDFCNSNDCYLVHIKHGDKVLYRITENPKQTESERLDALRFRREQECFRLVNRYIGRLTEEQEAEKAEWYRAWLDVTKTMIVPEKPEWLN